MTFIEDRLIGRDRTSKAWSMELGCDSITGLGAAARPALGECNFSKFYIPNVSHFLIY